MLRHFARHYDTGEPMPEDLLRRLLDGAHLQPGLRDASNTSPRRWSISTSISLTSRRRVSTSTRFEQADARAHRHAGGDRHAAPAAAFHPRVLRRRLCRRPITATCGRRCSTPTPSRRSRRPATSSIRRPREALRDNVYAAGGSRDPAELYTAFRGRLPTARRAAAASAASSRRLRNGRHETSTPPDIAAASSCAPHHAAAEAGRAILAEGGNALEAMVAMAATIAAVYPHMNHIGGDGFWLVREPYGPRARADGGGPRRRAMRGASSIASTRRSRRAGRSRRSPCRARSAAGCWRSKPRRRIGGADAARRAAGTRRSATPATAMRSRAARRGSPPTSSPS